MKRFLMLSATVLCLCAELARAQTPAPNALPSTVGSSQSCIEGQVMMLEHDRLAVCDSHGDFKQIQRVTFGGSAYISSGAKDLRPVSADLVDGAAHLRFAGGTSRDFPVPFALGDDGRLALVNYKIVRVGSDAEYVIPEPAETLVLKLGDREAIVQQQDRCSLRGVRVSGNANISCAD